MRQGLERNMILGRHIIHALLLAAALSLIPFMVQV